MNVASTSNGKKKKNKPNGFMVFLFEYKRQHKIDNMAQAQLEAGKVWQDMDDEDRAPYNQKANPGSSSKPKLDCRNRPLQETDPEEAEKQKLREETEKSIDSLLKKNSIQDLKATTIFIMACSYYYKDFTGHVFPAELAIAKFSLEEGIIDQLHMKINPGDLPLGSASSAKELAEKTHGYPLPRAESKESVSKYNDVFAEISKFLGVSPESKHPQFPPIFVHPGYDYQYEDLKATKLVLDTITVEARVNINFRVYPLEELLFRLVKMVNEFRTTEKPQHMNFESLNMAKSYLLLDRYSHKNIGCDFHNSADKSLHCCLAKVKRWCYIIAEKILDKQKGDKIVVGKHVPGTFDDMSSSISNLSLSDVKSGSPLPSLQNILKFSRSGRKPEK